MNVSWHASRRMYQRRISTAKVQAAIALGKILPDIQQRDHVVRYEHQGTDFSDTKMSVCVCLYQQNWVSASA